MEPTNAFVGRRDKPTPNEVRQVLGLSAEAWNEMISWLSQKHGITEEWKSYSPKFGWTVQLKLKKRTIVHLAPCTGCYQVLFILGDKAVFAAKTSKLSKSLTKTIADAPKYPEGTGIRLLVKTSKDLAAVRKLAEIKIAN